MIPDLLILALVAAGHLGILVYVTNVLHGVGWRPRWESPLKRGILLAYLVLTGWMAWESYQGGWNAWSWPMRWYAVGCLVIGTLGIPLSTWLLHMQRSPLGVTGDDVEINVERQLGRSALIGDGKHAWCLRIRPNSSLRLLKREWQVEIETLPIEWDGLTIVQVSDLHFAPCYRQAYFQHVLEEAGRWQADLVVFTGDLVDSDDAISWIVPLLSPLKGRLGSYAILGNHDYFHHPERVRGELQNAGFDEIDGRWTDLKIGRSRMAIGGTSAPWGPSLEGQRMPEADFRLLLSHTPDYFPRAARSRIDLMLSGHNHGGQIRLPAIGPVFMPSVYSRRYHRGYYRAGSTLLHVSQGVAGKHPIRIGCLPEISLLTLRAVGERVRSQGMLQRVGASDRLASNAPRD